MLPSIRSISSVALTTNFVPGVNCPLTLSIFFIVADPYGSLSAISILMIVYSFSVSPHDTDTGSSFLRYGNGHAVSLTVYVPNGRLSNVAVPFESSVVTCVSFSFPVES